MLDISISSNSAMEAVNHFKNSAAEADTTSKHGRSAVSHKNRGNIMQRAFLIFAVICVSITSAFAQDIILLRNGTEMQTVVSEIGTDDVKYKNFDNPSGPTYTVKKADIFMIRYANDGRERLSKSVQEVFEENSDLDTLFIQLAKIKGLKEFFDTQFLDDTEDLIIRMDPTLPPLAIKQHRDEVQQRFFNYTRMTFADLSIEVDKRLGPQKYKKEPNAFFGENRHVLLNRDNVKLFLDSYNPEIDEINAAIESKIDKIQQNAVIFIAPEYRNPFAYLTMRNYVRDGKVSNWKECVDLYEEQLHSSIVQKNSAEKQQTVKTKQNNTELFIKSFTTSFRIMWGLASGLDGMVNSAGSGMFERPRDSGVRYIDRESGNIYDESGNRVPW